MLGRPSSSSAPRRTSAISALIRSDVANRRPASRAGPGPPPAARWARGRTSRSRSRAPRLGRSGTTTGRRRPVLDTHADREARARLPPLRHARLHELADTARVERDERVLLQDPVLLVVEQELPGVVAGEAEAHLGEVVRAEGEELGLLR